MIVIDRKKCRQKNQYIFDKDITEAAKIHIPLQYLKDKKITIKFETHFSP